jgi:2-polyprenyl-3-methyl-5-hydroxy-6-metoxy-1,4-benzoquinol methylase
MSFRMSLAIVILAACSRDPSPATAPTSTQAIGKPPATPNVANAADPNLTRDQQEYVEDIMAFTKTTHDQVRDRMKQGSEPLKQEWTKWEADGEMTEPRIAAFYKQTTNYIYELGEWHLFVPGKRDSDLALVANLKANGVKNVLDFGGGVGMMAIPLARAGIDVTIADLDGRSLDFAAFRAARHGDKLKIWKSDVEAMPPDKTYDAILALDVLEHLPKQTLHDIVDKLIKLKHSKTEIVISAPFGKTAVHPMHRDLTDDTKQQVERLKSELPKN